jgi:hypothetical protein
MDWVKDHAVVNEGDVDRVLRFDPQLTTVVRLLNCDEVSLRIQFLCRTLA